MTASEDRTAHIWDLKTGLMLRQIQADAQVGSVLPLDGERVVTTEGNGKSKVWNWRTGAVLCTLGGAADAGAWPQTFSRHRSVLAGTDGKKHVVLWDAVTGTVLQQLPGNPDSNAVAFSPFDDAVLSSGKNTRLWRLGPDKTAGPQAPVEFQGGSGEFSPDGTRVLTHTDTAVTVWNSKSAQQTVTFGPHMGSFSSARFSPDGKSILVVESQKTTMLYDAQNGNVLRVVDVSEDKLRDAVFPATVRGF